MQVDIPGSNYKASLNWCRINKGELIDAKSEVWVLALRDPNVHSVCNSLCHGNLL